MLAVICGTLCVEIYRNQKTELRLLPTGKSFLVMIGPVLSAYPTMHVEKLSFLTLLQPCYLVIKKQVYGWSHSCTFGTTTAPTSDAFPPAVDVPEKRQFTRPSACRKSHDFSPYTSYLSPPSPRHTFAGLKDNSVTPPSCRCHSHHIPALKPRLKAENRRSLSDPPHHAGYLPAHTEQRGGIKMRQSRLQQAACRGAEGLKTPESKA